MPQRRGNQAGGTGTNTPPAPSRKAKGNEMRTVNLPKTATIAGRNIRLNWQINNSMDGWYAEVSPRRVSDLEKDDGVSMSDVEDELRQYGDSARYGQDRNGKTYLCVYKSA